MPEPVPFETIPGIPSYATSRLREEAWFRGEQERFNKSLEEFKGSDGLISDPSWMNHANRLKELRASRYRRNTLEWASALAGTDTDLKIKVRDRFLRDLLDDGNIDWRSFVPDENGAFRYQIKDAMYDKGEVPRYLNFDPERFPGAGKDKDYNGIPTRGRLDYNRHQFFPDTVSLENAFQLWNDIYIKPRTEQDIGKLRAHWNALAAANPDLNLVHITDSMMPERRDFPPIVTVKMRRPDGTGYDWKSLDELRETRGTENILPPQQDIEDSQGLDTGAQDSIEALKGRREARQQFQDAWSSALGENKIGPINNVNDIPKSNFWLFRDNLQTALSAARLQSLSEEDSKDFSDFGSFIWHVSPEDAEGRKPFKKGLADWGSSPSALKAVNDFYEKQLAKITSRSPALMHKKGTTMEEVHRKNYANIMGQIADNLEKHGKFTTERFYSGLPFAAQKFEWPEHVEPDDAYKVWDFYRAYTRGTADKKFYSTMGPEAIDPDFNEENKEAMELFSQYMNIIALMRKNGMQTSSFSHDAGSKFATYEVNHGDGSSTKKAYTYPLAHSGTVSKLDEMHDIAIRFPGYRFELGPKTWTEEGVAFTLSETEDSRAEALKEEPKISKVPKGTPSSEDLRKAARGAGIGK